MVTWRDGRAITKKTRHRWSPASVRTSTVNRRRPCGPPRAPAGPSSRACASSAREPSRSRGRAGPAHRGPSDLVAEVRERPADPCIPPLGILDHHPDHERGHVTSRHRPASTAAGAAGVCLGDQSPVTAENRVRRDDAGDLHHDAPSELLAAHGESTALGIGQAKRPRAQVLPEDQATSRRSGRSRNTTLAHASPETTDAESAQPLGVEPRLGPVRARVGPRPPAPSPRVPRSRAGPSCGPWRDSRHTNGRWSGLAALTRCRVVRGGGAKRGAGRRGRPRGVAAGLAPPASAAPDRQRAGPRRRAVPARG